MSSMRSTRAAGTALLVPLLISCGGGGGSGEAANPALVISTRISISGIVATGAPVSNAMVTLKCGDETLTAKTNDKGEYSALVLSLPCSVTASAADLFLRSFARQGGTTNVTPLTNMLVVASNGDSTKLAAAKRSQVENLKLVGVQVASDPITTAFVANGIGADSQLDAFGRVAQQVNIYGAGSTNRPQALSEVWADVCGLRSACAPAQLAMPIATNSPSSATQAAYEKSLAWASSLYTSLKTTAQDAGYSVADLATEAWETYGSEGLVERWDDFVKSGAAAGNAFYDGRYGAAVSKYLTSTFHVASLPLEVLDPTKVFTVTCDAYSRGALREGLFDKETFDANIEACHWTQNFIDFASLSAGMKKIGKKVVDAKAYTDRALIYYSTNAGGWRTRMLNKGGKELIGATWETYKANFGGVDDDAREFCGTLRLYASSLGLSNADVDTLLADCAAAGNTLPATPSISKVEPSQFAAGVSTWVKVYGSSIPVGAYVAGTNVSCESPFGVSDTGFSQICTFPAVNTTRVSVRAPDGTEVGSATLTQTPSQRLSIPTGMAPGSLSAPGSSVYAGNLRLSWNVVDFATSYRLNIRQTGTGSVDILLPSGNEAQVQVAAGQSYVWNVSACRDGNCTSYAPPMYFQTVAKGIATPTVSGHSPASSALNQATTFAYTGSNLVSGMGFTVTNCDSTTDLGGNSASRSFTCVPRTAGPQSIRVTDAPGGTLLYTGAVTVSGPAPTVTGHSPSTATPNQVATFTYTGSNLTQGMGYTVTNCDTTTDLGGSSTSRSFSCIPRSSGAQTLTIKALPGLSSSLYTGTVTVSTPVTPPRVTGHSPTTATLNQTTTFTYTGANLVSGMGFTVTNCDTTTDQGGGTTSRSFSCVPRTAGAQTLTIKAAPGGTTLYNGTVTVGAPLTPPTVSGHSPTTATLNQTTTVIYTGANLVSGMGFTVTNCDTTTDLGGGTTSRSFSCVPRTAGAQTLTIKAAPGGTTLYNGTVTVSAPVTPPTVSGHSPTTATLNQTTTVTYTGANLVSGMGFTVTNCDTTTDLGGGTTSRSFSCVPRTAGAQTLTIKAAPGGTTLYNGTVTVSAPVTPPTVTGHSPSTATLNQTTTVTYTGANLVSGMGFTVTNCDTTTDLGGGTTSRSFSCVSRTAGAQTLTIKAAPGGTTLYNGTVTVSVPAPTVTSHSPSTATRNQVTTFTYSGSNLVSGMGFTMSNCDTTTDLGGGTTSRSFSCIPRATGAQTLTVKTAPGGGTLYTGAVNVP